MPVIDTTTGLFLVFLISTILLYLLGRVNISFIVSLILSGIILGQFSLIYENEIFKEIADFGLIFMLFFVGVEFSLRILWNYRKEAIFLGVGQILFTFIVFFLISYLVFLDWKISFIISSVFTISSTAMIISIVEKKGVIGVRYGRISFLVALIQDIFSIIILVLLPFIVDNSGGLNTNLILGIFVFILYFYLLYRFTKTKFSEMLVVRDRYLLVFLAILISFGSAFVAKVCGLSPFLGAFLAGMIISESSFGRQVASEIFPIKEIFIGFFFIYIGALVNLKIFFENILIILGLTAGVIILKFGIMFLISLLKREPIEHSIKSSSLLSNVGEFGLLILSIALSTNILDVKIFSIFVGVIVFSIAIGPFLFSFSEYLERKFPFLRIRKINRNVLGEFDVLVVGYGPIGRKVVKILNDHNISNVILEMNYETVSKFDKLVNIHFGDAKRESILRWCGLEKAKLLVITVPIVDEVIYIAEKAKSINPDIIILARVRFESQITLLKDIGIQYVLCDETSVAEFFSKFVMDILSIK
ncbi:MAG: cation:proton antiporter [Brevinematia bacterium]